MKSLHINHFVFPRSQVFATSAFRCRQPPHPVSNEWHFSSRMGDEGQYDGGDGGERQEGAGGGGDVQPLTLLESASQHAAVTTATVTCGPTAGARPTTARAN